MTKVSSLSYIDITKNLLNKKVHFISDCDLFPNFDIKCTVYKVYFANTNNEILMDVKILDKNKKITVGSNMKNLQYELI